MAQKNVVGYPARVFAADVWSVDRRWNGDGCRSVYLHAVLSRQSDTRTLRWRDRIPIVRIRARRYLHNVRRQHPWLLSCLRP